MKNTISINMQKKLTRNVKQESLKIIMKQNRVIYFSNKCNLWPPLPVPVLNRQKSIINPTRCKTLLFLFIVIKAMLNLFFFFSSAFVSLCRLMWNRTARTLKFEKRSTIYLLVSLNNLFDVNLCWEDLGTFAQKFSPR